MGATKDADPVHTLHLARAFGSGADTRIAGLPRGLCPYLGQLKVYWTWGWDHANTNWGADSRRPVRPLPKINREQGCTRNGTN